jgi:hypothetical protein
MFIKKSKIILILIFYRVNLDDVEHEGGHQSYKPPTTRSELFHSATLVQINKFKNTPKDSRSPALKSYILDKCDKSMRERRVLNYKVGDILHYLIWCTQWRSTNSLKDKERFRDHLYFEIGEEKLIEELEVVNIIKSMRKLKILFNVILNKQQKFMMKFQREHVINSSSSETSDEGKMNIVGKNIFLNLF